MGATSVRLYPKCYVMVVAVVKYFVEYLPVGYISVEDL